MKKRLILLLLSSAFCLTACSENPPLDWKRFCSNFDNTESEITVFTFESEGDVGVTTRLKDTKNILVKMIADMEHTKCEQSEETDKRIYPYVAVVYGEREHDYYYNISFDNSCEYGKIAYFKNTSILDKVCQYYTLQSEECQRIIDYCLSLL